MAFPVKLANPVQPLARAAFGAPASFGHHVLDIDYARAASEIEDSIRTIVSRRLHRRGVVLGASGGIDSSVCAALAARALGPDRVRALLMPERESSARSAEGGRLVCDHLGVAYEIENITTALDALGCYRRRLDAVRTLFPGFGEADRFKIAVAGDMLSSDRMNFFTLIVETAKGRQSKRMPLTTYLEIVAATNLKQRVRKTLEYTHAERLNYAVIGTPNRLEYDQGFFVRGGDGLADLKPIAHLYKTQVYGMARHLGLPDAICRQSPTTDTYSLPQSQEEFYFALPYDVMDLLLYAFIHRIPAGETAAGLGLDAAQVERAWRDIEAKRRVSRQLHQPALLARDYDWAERER